MLAISKCNGEKHLLKVAITGHLGDKAASVARQLGIEMTPLDDRQRSVEEVILMIKKRNFTFNKRRLLCQE